MANKEVYRPAGMLERYHIAFYGLKLEACVVVAGRFVDNSKPQSALTRENVLPALAYTVHTHAALSARIVRRGKDDRSGYLYERMEKVDIESAVRFLDTDGSEVEEDISSLIEREMSESAIPDPSSGLDKPLWRLIVTPKNLIIFAWHHCIGDGQSGLAFLRTLLDGFNSQHPQFAGADFRALETKPDLNLTPPIEDLLRLRISTPTLLSAISTIFIPSSWRERKVWTGNMTPTEADIFATRVRLITIPPPVVTRILSAARAHSATLTAVLYILSVNVLSSFISSELAKTKNKKYSRLNIGNAVSHRPLAGIPPTAMCELVSIFTSSESLHQPTPSTPGFSWDRAAAYTKKLHKGIPRTIEIIACFKFLSGKFEEFHKKKLGKKRGESIVHSNLGAFKLSGSSTESTSGGWTVTDTYFAQDEGITGAAIKINTVGAPSGSVNTTIAWSKGSIDDENAEAFVRDLRIAIGILDDELVRKNAEGKL